MKTQLTYTCNVIRAAVLLFLVTFSSSCEKEEQMSEKRPLSIYTIPTNDTLPPIIAENTTLVRGRTWYLKGVTYLVNQVTLHIDSGAVVKMLHQPGVNEEYPAGGLIVARGSRIIAKGTKAYPILFLIGDSALYKPNAWNGIIVLGRTPSNHHDVSINHHPWISGGLSYGGNLPNDSSGILEHIRFERNANELQGDARKIPSGIKLVSVGSRTVIKDVAVYPTGKRPLQ